MDPGGGQPWTPLRGVVPWTPHMNNQIEQRARRTSKRCARPSGRLSQMDRERIEQELHDLEQWLDDPPPLLTLVVLSNGRGLAYPYPLFDDAGEGPLERRHAALTLVRAFLADFVLRLDTQLTAIERSQAIYRQVYGEVERPTSDD